MPTFSSKMCLYICWACNSICIWNIESKKSYHSVPTGKHVIVKLSDNFLKNYYFCCFGWFMILASFHSSQQNKFMTLPSFVFILRFNIWRRASGKSLPVYGILPPERILFIFVSHLNLTMMIKASFVIRFPKVFV